VRLPSLCAASADCFLALCRSPLFALRAPCHSCIVLLPMGRREGNASSGQGRWRSDRGFGSFVPHVPARWGGSSVKRAVDARRGQKVRRCNITRKRTEPLAYERSTIMSVLHGSSRRDECARNLVVAPASRCTTDGTTALSTESFWLREREARVSTTDAGLDERDEQDLNHALRH
jgi:hypothetical protein